MTYKWTFNNTLENVIELPSINHNHSDHTIPSDGTNFNVIHSTDSLIYSHNRNYQNLKTTENYRHGEYIPGPLHHHQRHQENKMHHNNQIQQQHQLHHSEIPQMNNNGIYSYKVESFQSFGTVTCVAQNPLGQSGPCMYHIMAAELPDPVQNCTSSNATGTSVFITCIPGNDGGIQQYFQVEVLDEHSKSILYNQTFRNPLFILKRLPSDTEFRIRVTSFNLQGPSSRSFKLKVRTLQPPLLQTGMYNSYFNNDPHSLPTHHLLCMPESI